MFHCMGTIVLTYRAYSGHPYLKMFIGCCLIAKQYATHLLSPFTSVGFSCNKWVRFQNKVRFKSFASCFLIEIKYQLELIVRAKRYQFNIIKFSWRLSAVVMQYNGATIVCHQCFFATFKIIRHNFILYHK